jgi:HAD superfamily hydrolase (TIGR01509 family)
MTPIAPSLPAALLLDVDGTLAETERDGHRVAFNRAFAENGLDWCWSEGLYTDLLAVSGGRARMRAYAKLSRTALHDELLSRLHRCKADHYRSLVRAGAVPLRPGVQRLVGEALAAGVRLGLVTDSTDASVATLLEALLPELVDALAVRVVGSMVKIRKPDPEGYRMALRSLGLPAVRCLALEDSGKGACAALAAGVPTLVTVSSTSAADDFGCASAVITCLGDDETPTEVLSGPACPAGRVDLAWCGALL